MRRSSSRLVFALSVTLAAASVERTARAADPQAQQLAQALFDEGRRLMDARRYADACPKLAESQRLDPGGGTLLNLAICHEREGKLATAHVDFNDALALALKDRRKDRATIARERIAAIEPAMPRLTIVVPAASDIDGLEVKLDGLVLRRAAWGLATPVDPGEHLIAAKAPGHTAWSSSIAIEPSLRRNIDVPLLRADALAPSSPMVTMGPTSAQNTAPVDAGRATPSGAKKDNPFFYVVIGVTILAAGTAGVTGLLAFANNAVASTGCLPDRNFCRDQVSIDAAGRAKTHAWISTVSLGIAVAGAVSIFFVPQRVQAARPTVSASALPGGGQLSVTGAF